MAHSVEVRTPFLDNELVEFGLKQNISNLFKFTENNITKRKIPLMKIHKKLFNVDFSDKAKIGFRVPFDEWIQNKIELRKFCSRVLSNTEKYEELNHNKIKDMRYKLQSDEIIENYEVRIVWLLTNYLLWRKSTS